MPPSGAMIVLPSCVKEYSTAMAFDLVTRLAINPVDSRLRRVLVSIRCETLPRWRRNSPCRRGLSSSENNILGVHLPIKIGEGVFDPSIVFIVSPLALSSAAPQGPRLPVPASQMQLGTYVYLTLISARGLSLDWRQQATTGSRLSKNQD
jgi:hypothetical protein